MVAGSLEMFKTLGAKLDASEEERATLEHLTERLWTGDWMDPGSQGNVKTVFFAKQRLQMLLAKAADVRRTYQSIESIGDTDYDRTLTKDETSAIHNLWMNDVSSWMNTECLQKYWNYMREATAADKKTCTGKSKGKGKGKGTGKAQKAQQLKKQRFNKIVNDIARNNVFFFSFVRCPGMQTREGIENVITQIEAFKESKEYREIADHSRETKEQRTRLKRKRADARLRLKRGQRDANENRNTAFAKAFRTGELARECAAAETRCGRRKVTRKS